MPAIAHIAPPHRALIIKPSALGDVVTALPVLRGLRRSFGRHTRIDWMLSRPCAPLVADDPDLDGVVEFDRQWYGTAWRSPTAAAALAGFCRRLHEARYDWVIDLQGLFRSGFFAAATGAPVRAGFAKAREFARLFYNHVLPVRETPTHTVDRNIALARWLGIDARPGDYRLFVAEPARRWGRQFVAEHGEDFIVVAPATRWATKLYPARHWRVVVGELARRAKVVLVAGPGEETFTAPLADGPNVVDLAGRTSLSELTALVAAARGVISCDSATMNVAAALGARQVTIVGPTDPARTGPYACDKGVVQSQLPCRACLKRSCTHMTCMQTIVPTEVLAAAEKCFWP